MDVQQMVPTIAISYLSPVTLPVCTVIESAKSPWTASGKSQTQVTCLCN